MKINLYSIFDKVAEEFGPLYQAKNDAVAQRNFYMAVKDIDGTQHDLYRIGSWDTETGLLNSIDTPVAIPTNVRKQLELELERRNGK